jgi:hypothetical protein
MFQQDVEKWFNSLLICCHYNCIKGVKMKLQVPCADNGKCEADYCEQALGQ